jgi:hypothetical protein
MKKYYFISSWVIWLRHEKESLVNGFVGYVLDGTRQSEITSAVIGTLVGTLAALGFYMSPLEPFSDDIVIIAVSVVLSASSIIQGYGVLIDSRRLRISAARLLVAVWLFRIIVAVIINHPRPTYIAPGILYGYMALLNIVSYYHNALISSQLKSVVRSQTDAIGNSNSIGCDNADSSSGC